MASPVIVIGSAGALGQEIASQLHAEAVPIHTLNRSNLDIGLNLPTLVEMLQRLGPRAVINCLAMTGLDKCFRDQPQAFEANGLFPNKLAMASKILDLPVIQISTESVFSCNINELTYKEGDKVQPTTVYGLSKLLGESHGLRCSAPFYVVRLPLLYGPTNGRQIVARMVKELLRGNEVNVALDVYSTPVYTPDAASFIVNGVVGRTKLATVTHLTSGHRISLHELICIIAKGLESKGKIQPTLSSRFPSLEKKPLHGGLQSDVADRLPWEGAVSRYVSWIKANQEVITDE
jgi:dTDP-4-dehydrorhamnose reductase